MVKMITLMGQDSDRLRNSFNDNIIISPKSKVALLDAYAEFNSALVKDYFTIDDNSNTFEIYADSYVPVECTIQNGEYNLLQFMEYFQQACNRTTINVANYMDITANTDKGFFQLAARKALFSIAKFDTAWNINTGTPVLNAGSITGNGADNMEIFCKYAVPRQSGRIATTVQALGDGTISLYAGGDLLYSIIISAGVYRVDNGLVNVIVPDNGTMGGAIGDPINAQVGDLIVISHSDQSVGADLIRAGGASKAVDAIEIDDVSYINRWEYVIKIPGGQTTKFGADTGGDATYCTVLSPESINSPEHLTTATTNFGIIIQDAYLPLRKYTGIRSGGARGSGDPAIVTGDFPIDGDGRLPGINVVLRRGILESYDGQTGKQFNSIAKLHLEKHSTGVNTRMQPIAIDLNNTREENYKNWEVVFLAEADATPLSFSGKAVVTLVVYGEDEK